MDIHDNKKLIFIIGAPRSGTNMLRDFICLHPEITCFPCDEIPFLWRYGGQFLETDIPEPNWHASKSAVKVKSILSRWISQKMTKENSVFIEKTCANSLRVRELSRLFPDAKFIFILRSGFDVVASSNQKKLNRDISKNNILSKLKFIPLSQICQVVVNILVQKLVYGVLPWGPRILNNTKRLKTASDAEYVLLQWKQCVSYSLDESAELERERCLFLGYENFVRDPEGHAERISSFINVDKTGFLDAVGFISQASINKGTEFCNTILDEKSLAEIEIVNGWIAQRLGL